MGKGSQIYYNGGKLDLGWGAHNAVHRCQICWTREEYIMLLTNVTPINLTLKKKKTEEPHIWLKNEFAILVSWEGPN